MKPRHDRKLESLRAVLAARPENPDVMEELLSLRFREQVASAKAGFLTAYGGIIAKVLYDIFVRISDAKPSLPPYALEWWGLGLGFAFLSAALMYLVYSFFAFERYPQSKPAAEHMRGFSERDMKKERAVTRGSRLLLGATFMLIATIVVQIAPRFDLPW